MVKQTIGIFARVKPTKAKTGPYEVEAGGEHGAVLSFTVPKDAADGLVNNKKENYKFMFEKVFDQSTKQEEIFENVARPVVDNVLSGYNGTIFAYGQTGSGKTFTITGGPERYADRGIIPRTLAYIFEQYEKMPEREFSTHVSYLEIYNESGYDLLDPKHEAAKLEDLPKVTLMEDDNQNIHLKNLSTHPAANEEDALNLLFLGDTNRMIAETPMNQASTRSHCIFTIHLTSREAGSATVRRSKLHLVDLAGSERVAKTGVNGVLLTEAKYINLSLHYLEQVIVALSEKSRQHIPYRNSMMTSVLRDSLGGNCMTTMIATCSVERRNIDESISTCRFAQRVAMIKNDAFLNEEMDPQLLIEKLRQEIAQLKEELALVTGRQPSDVLTEEEVEQCEKMVDEYLKDEKQDATIGIGADMRKIKLCYAIMKRKLRELIASASFGTQPPPASDGGADSNRSAAQMPGLLDGKDVRHLQELLLQRDNEINILVSMLKKEKRKVAAAATAAAAAAAQASAVQAAAAAAAGGGGGSSVGDTLPFTGRSAAQSVTSHRSHDATSSEIIQHDHDHRQQRTEVSSSAKSVDTDSTRTVSRPRSSSRPVHISAESAKKILGDMSVGRAEAFEIFRRDYDGNASIDESKHLLKQRFIEAKALGEEVNRSRSNINKIKAQLEHHRLQMAASSAQKSSGGSRSTGDGSAVTQPPDSTEEHLREAMEQEKLTYKEKFGQLKTLKAEIEHMQHLLEKSKVKLMKDFELWWAEQVTSASGNGIQSHPLVSSSRSAANLPVDSRSAWRTPPGSSQARDAEVVGRSRPVGGGSAARPAAGQHYGITGGSLSGDGAETPAKTPDVDTFSTPNFASRSAAQPPLLPAQPVFRPSSSRSSSNVSSETVSLTGDAQADADIMAFLRARHSVLQKASQRQQLS